MANVKKEVHVEGLGTIFYCNDSSFDEASEAVLNGKAGNLITLKELAYARITEGKDSSVSTNGSYVREGSLFIPKAPNKRIWLRESVIPQNASGAVEAHRKGKEYLVPQGFNVAKHLESIGKDNYFVLSDTTPVPTDRFGEDERMQWAFGDKAQAYGQFLADAKIKNLNIWMYTDKDSHIDSQEKPFANQLWLHRLDDNSNIDGDARDLNNSNWVRGVRYENAVGDAPKNMYSISDITSKLHKIGIVPDSDFEKVILKEFNQ